MSQESPPLDLPGTPNREHQLRFLVNVLTRHWLLIFVFTAIASLLYGVFGLIKMREEPSGGQYSAQARILVKRSFWDRDILKGMSGTPLTPLDPETLVRNTSTQTLSEKIARALVQQDMPGGHELSDVSTDDEIRRKAAEVEGMVKLVVENPQNDVITISVVGCKDKEEASRLAEVAARVFVEETRQTQTEEERKTYEAVKKRLDELQRELSAAETAQWDYRKKMDFQTYGQAGDDLAKIYQEINEKKALKEVTLSRLAEIEAQLKANNDQLPESLGTVTDTVVTQLMGDLDKLLQKQLTMSVIYNDQYPELQTLKEDIGEKKQAILEAVRQLDQSIGGGTNIWRQRQELYRQQLDLRVAITSNDIRVAALQRMIDELVPKIPQLANQNLEFERLAKDTDHIRLEFNRLREKELDIRTALNRESGQVQRHESVTVSAVSAGDSGRRWWVNFFIGAVVGLAIGFGLAIMFEIMDTSIRSIEDVATYVGLEVIGTIPRMRFGKGKEGRRKGTYVSTTDEDQIDACIVTQHDPKSPISEAYRTLRTNFQFATINIKPRTVMVTSAVPGEGKTTTAVNFAVTMADRGIRVLLIDTDLRRPNVHRVLKIERGPGLADVLREGLDVHSVIRKTRIENLWIISSGRVPPNPSELIGSDRMQRVIKQLGAEFDLVVCDAPSVLVVTDPVLLSTHVDTSIVVISVNNARRETVQRAQKLLQAASASIAGVVLNGLEATRRHYYYYYYYYEDGGRGQRRWYHL